MNLVQPIRSKESIDELGQILRNADEKYFVMYRIGLTSGLRISDILTIKAKDVKRNYIQVIEKKTSKLKVFKLNSKTKQLCIDFVEKKNLGDEDYIVYSRKKDKEGNIRPITRQQAHVVLKRASMLLNMEDISTHTLRKTFGYWHYKQYRDVVVLQQIFNHSSPSVTLRYIGITQDTVDRTIEDLDI
ncbi:MAG: tyrosine-type recombinase/integrase [Paraclostridium sp.]